MITQNSNDTSTQASTQLSEKELKASMSAEEKKQFLRNKDAERKRRKRLEEKDQSNSLAEQEKIEIKQRGKSLEHKVKEENSKKRNNQILFKNYLILFYEVNFK